MTDFPEKIWLADDDDELTRHAPVYDFWYAYKPDFTEESSEYIRADLVPQWQPIDTAPKNGTQILLWDGKYEYLGSWRCDDNLPDEDPQWFDNSYDDFSCGYSSIPIKPTHWMPIPKVPE